jgi:hypothetical protein
MSMRSEVCRACRATFVAGSLLLLLLAAVPVALGAPFFQSETAPVKYVSTQEGEVKMETNSGVVQCTTATREGESASTSTEEIEFALTLSGCKAFGFISATSDMNGCKWRDRLVSGSSPPTANTSIVCPAGQEITITTAFCIVHFPPQTSKPHIVYQNQGSGTGRDWTETQTISGLTYTATSGCTSPGTAANGAMIDAFTVKGFKGNGQQQGIWVQ